ncbi:MAG TPA: RHS repeat-associated core domain-containing protein [Acidobacteriaceae bacterium]|jgi:RHS repeat-associated protein
MTRIDANAFGEVSAIPPRYTGKERDSESGLDYMDARYYGSSMGRFMSPDPIFASAARVMDPQQWNMYAYARNNPLSNSDPTGLDFNLKCSGGDSLTCQGGVQGQTLLADGGGTRFEATVVAGSADSGYKDQFGGQYSGTFSETSGVSFTDKATGDVSNHSQFIEGSNATSVNGSGAFAGITANFFNACGGSCQARGTLTGTADAFTSMKSQLVQSSAFKSFLDGLSMAHPLISDQWKDANGYAHLIKAPGDIMDMHFEGASTGAGLQAFILHAVSTIKDIGSGNAFHQRGLMTPGKDPDEK